MVRFSNSSLRLLVLEDGMGAGELSASSIAFNSQAASVELPP